MARVPNDLREQVLAYWRGHSEAWKLSRLTQQQYCAKHNISLKSFGNWRGQLKRVALAGPEARWGRYPELRTVTPMVNHMAKPGVNPMAKTPQPVSVPPPGTRRQFSEDLKLRIVAETYRSGASVSETARRYGLDLRMLFRWRKKYASVLPRDQTVGDQP
jgi:hypothetical protein